MPEWLLLALAVWFAVAVVLCFALVRVLAWSSRFDHAETAQAQRLALQRDREFPVETAARVSERTRILVVDDDPAFRALVVATLAGDDFDVAEAASAEEARGVAARGRPEVVLLDVSLPGVDGLVFCAELEAMDRSVKVVLLTGTDISEEDARSAGAEAVLRKPFSPLALLDVLDRLTAATALPGVRALPGGRDSEDSEQLIVYARDLARVIEIERAQRHLLENAYRQTVTALASTLEARDTGTTVHSMRVTHYALELARHTCAGLVGDPTVVYGFLLHDIGKIGIPDRILLKEGTLDPFERRLMQRHPEIGEQILSEVAILQGEGLGIVRSHHERWDGAGYPDRLAGESIPRGARVFAVADALDALTSDRPYRRARPWSTAIHEIEREAGQQFEPQVVRALLREEKTIRAIRDDFARQVA
jgi:response regulator RpfG family c-di-GMP phosphodiesterase